MKLSIFATILLDLCVRESNLNTFAGQCTFFQISVFLIKFSGSELRFRWSFGGECAVWATSNGAPVLLRVRSRRAPIPARCFPSSDAPHSKRDHRRASADELMVLKRCSNAVLKVAR